MGKIIQGVYGSQSIDRDKDEERHNGRLTNMILKLQEYDYELKYTPGRTHYVPDALSRTPIAEKEGGEGVIAALIEEKGKEKEVEDGRKRDRREGTSKESGKGRGRKNQVSNYKVQENKGRMQQENVEEWARRRYRWIGNLEEISVAQLEDDTIEEYRAIAVERNRRVYG